jgi:centromere/kinetochore protein ZW10
MFLGIGTPTIAQHFEKKMVAQDGGMAPAQAGSKEVADWDAGWDSDEKDEPEAEVLAETNSASHDKEHGAFDTQESQASPQPNDDDDDAADAWGWGEDDATDEAVPDPQPAEDEQHSTHPEKGSEMREVTLSEPYWISSIPKLVFDIIKVIYDDGGELTKPEYVRRRRISA